MTAVPSDPSGPPSDPQVAAEALASLGWRTIPIAPGKKYPQMSAWQQAATDDLPTIRNWYSGLYKGHGVGVATGAGSGVWVLDVDIADGKTGAQALAQLQAEHGDLPATVMAITGTGGLHLFYRWEPGRPVTNGHAARLPSGLDIRGEGGQVVAAPTVHATTGRPYAWAAGRDPWSIDVAPAPDWLYDLLLEQPEPVSGSGTAVSHTGTAPQTAVPDPDPDSIAGWARTVHQFDRLLEGDGWALHSTHGEDTWWTRPGKDPRAGHSAVLHGTDGPLVVFTTELSPDLVQAGTSTVDGSGVAVSLFGYLAGTRHQGDRSACARALRVEHDRRTGRLPAGPIDGAALIAPGVREPGAAAVGPLVAVPEHPSGQGIVDLASWWDDPQPPKQPDMLYRSDSVGLLYVDQLNWIHGDSGSGKTWILLHAAAQAVTAGFHVAWVHYEDPNPATIVQRLRLLGVDRAAVVERFHYWDPQGEPLAAPSLLEACQDFGVVHVGLDSVGEALNAAGRNEDSDAEVGPWIAGGPRALVNRGIGVTCLDHGTKDAKTAPLHPSGSKRKRAAVTGMGLLVRADIPPTRTTDGRMQIICGKDRHGNHPAGQTIGVAYLRHDITTGMINFSVAGSTGGGEDEAVAEKRIREVARIVGSDPGLSRNQLLALMSTGAKSSKNNAIDAAIRTGLIRVEIGPRNAQEMYPDE